MALSGKDYEAADAALGAKVSPTRPWADLRRRVAEALARARAEGRREMREAAAKVAEAQPYYPDTLIGMRQQWVKEQIAAAIRALDSGEDRHG